MAIAQEELFDLLWGLHRAGRPSSLGVMGGTFNPVHVGHTAMADAARDELGLDGVLYVPAGNPNFKQGLDIVAAHHRLKMVELACASRPACAASSLEIDRAGVTYTYDTLVELRDVVPPSTRVVFVMGGDSLGTFALWHRAADLVHLAHYAVAPREGSSVAASLAALRAAGLDPVVHVLATPVPTVSSTQLRGLLASGGRTDGLLDPAVAEYIVRHRLYRPAGARDAGAGERHGA